MVSAPKSAGRRALQGHYRQGRAEDAFQPLVERLSGEAGCLRILCQSDYRLRLAVLGQGYCGQGCPLASQQQ